MFSRTLRLIMLLVLLAASVPVVGAQATPQPVTMILTGDPPSFDPHGRLGPSGPIILAYVYDTLLAQTENGGLQPQLAETWDVSEDGLTITFTLRRDVLFSNDAPVNADAVIFTFERLQATGQQSLIYGEIANITAFEKVDDFTVRFHLAEPSASLLSALTYSYAAILEPGAVEAAGDPYGEAPVGSGPFMLAEWVPQSSMTLVPNPNYAGHRAYDDDPALNVDELHIRFTADQTTRINALQSGEADIAYITSAPLLAPVQDNPDFQIVETPARGVIFVGFNHSDSPFADLHLRQAVAYAVDNQAVVDIATDGLGIPTRAPLPQTIFGHNPELDADALPYDPAAAAELLAAAGYSPANPLPVRLLTLTVPTYQTIATVLQAELSAVGIAAEIETLDYGGLIAAMNDGDYDMVVLRYDWNDPDVLRVYLSEAAIGAGNRYFYANPDFDALLDEGRRTFDPAARFDVYTEAQRLFMEDLPLLPLYVPVTNVVIAGRIQNVDVVHSYITLENAALSD